MLWFCSSSDFYFHLKKCGQVHFFFFFFKVGLLGFWKIFDLVSGKLSKVTFEFGLALS